MAQKKLDIQLEQKVRGEEDLVVAGASILARAAFLEGMQKLSDEYGFTLPKGASAVVKVTAKALLAKWGTEILPKLAKMHFKTANEL
jgi:ribonuclease HIII